MAVEDRYRQLWQLARIERWVETQDCSREGYERWKAQFADYDPAFPQVRLIKVLNAMRREPGAFLRGHGNLSRIYDHMLKLFGPVVAAEALRSVLEGMAADTEAKG